MSAVDANTNQAFIHSPNFGLTTFKHVLKQGLLLLHHTITCYLQLFLRAVCFAGCCEVPKGVQIGIACACQAVMRGGQRALQQSEDRHCH